MGKRKQKIPGCIYQNGFRWWWKVKLPGEKKVKARPLIPDGGQWATDEKPVAKVIARNMWERATAKQDADLVHTDNCTIAAMTNKYIEYAKSYYVRDGVIQKEAMNIKYALANLVEMYPDLPAEELGPKKLELVQKAMIEKDISRTTINKWTGITKRFYKWLAKEQYIPETVYRALCLVPGLRKGRSGARETEPIRPVPVENIKATLPYAPPTVRAMIELQLYTGMRPGELVIMKPSDIDTTGKIWQYRLTKHKTDWLSGDKIVLLGPRAQKVLEPFLARPLDSYCFSPAEAQQQRHDAMRAARKTPVQPSQQDRSKDGPRLRPPSERYQTGSYRQAIENAIKKACRDDVSIPRWTPHRLRHTAATLTRKHFGLDAARALLGHRHLSQTDEYAEIDKALAAQVVAEIG